MSSYTPAQLDAYFERIDYPRSAHPEGRLALVDALQARQLAYVPFEDLTLHYSPHRVLSLEPDDLFEKIVQQRKGGYCMELNTLFGAVLRGLGFKVMHLGGRVMTPDGWTGMSHMVNIVTVDNQRYLVDVGYGRGGPMRPVPLVSGSEFDQIAPARGRLLYTSLPEHSDPSQRVWLYSTAEPGAGGEFKPQYCFVDVELFPADYEVMNFSTMTARTSLFVQYVLAVRAVLDEEKNEVIGLVTLFGDSLKKRVRDKVELEEKLGSEAQRIEALEKWFGLVLSEKEKSAIKGTAVEILEKTG
ncbi:acetyltransferase-like protein [Sodiomyces alkalinus F11]|uniref:Acetyltransferase-like protein n=1 Tax=Sodiomyces alkalinus (strain CBS 110278 / VKM F-3762 / F11) TaxID=1314773 RepID=A0A3N2PV50_SODAK|nr:acetyltransferase-like protein [Sodiomyces alkalinus F11]ROT38382.1 acetyltransferase-like protein [Sodiomyces alkalinus F11]